MNYDDILEEIEDIDLRINSIKRALNQNIQKIGSLQGANDSLDRALQSEIDRERASALNAKQKEVSSGLDKKISELEAKKIKMKEKFDSLNGVITLDEYKKKHADKYIDTSAIKDTLDLARNAVVDSVGERFQQELYNQLSEQSVDIDISNLEQLNTRFNKRVKELSMFNSLSRILGSEKAQGIKEFMRDKATPFKDEKADEATVRVTVIRYILICAALSFVVIYFGALYLLLVITIMATLNIYKNWRIYNLVIECKLVEDNIKNIDDRINKEIEDEVTKDKEKLQNNFDKSVGKISSSIESVNNELQESIAQLTENFVFDDTKILERNKQSKQSNEKEISKLKVESSDLENSQKKLLMQKADLQAQLGNEMNNEVKRYINYDSCGDINAVDLLTKYLLDMKDKELVFWEHPKKSILFVYQDYEYAKKFARLIATQICCNMSPFAYTINVYDCQYRCNGFYEFIPSDEKKKRVTELYTDSNQTKTEMGKVYKRYARDYFEITNNAKDIFEYNEDAKAVRADPKSFHFEMLMNVTSDILTSDEVSDMLRNGSDAGYLFMIFMSDEQASNLKEQMDGLVDNCGSHYVISNDDVSAIAPDTLKKAYKK